MAKIFSEFVCQQCGFKSSSFLGRCPECGEWNSLVETKTILNSGKSSLGDSKVEESIISLSKVRATSYQRVSCGIDEFDRVLGGGIVPGSIILLSGDPGVGKSTLLIEAAIAIASREGKRKISSKTSQSTVSSKPTRSTVLYVCGEESPEQVRLRAERIKKNKAVFDNIFLLPITSVEDVVSAAIKTEPSLIVVDSIQTLTTGKLSGSAGTIGQIRETAQVLQILAKRSKIPIFVVGHMTKEGSIAGPKVLEHLVDAVLSLEGDGMHAYRILRANKNRFGSTSEVGVFEMSDEGMREVKNASKIFLSGQAGETAGSVVSVSMAGDRPILVEVQALVTPTMFGVPTRRVTGLDYSRAQLVLAALTRVAKIPFGTLDVYLNVAGGLKVIEPAVDLAMALAVVSASRGVVIPKNVCAFGEVGLLGELRKVGFSKNRINEAKRLGFSDFLTAERFRTVSEVISKVLKQQ